MIREIECQIRGLEHELQCIRSIGGTAGSPEILEIETGLSALSEALKGCK